LKSRITYDLHTHTTYSHGLGSILDNVKEAHRKGLTCIGITDHGPGHMSYGIKMSEIENMRKDIAKAKELYPDMDIQLGVEANIINADGQLDVSKEEQKLFDYVIAGYHYAYLGENKVRGALICAGAWLSQHHMPTSIYTIERNTDFFIKAMYENDIKILTHPGDKIRIDIKRIAQAAEKRGILLEINNHHGHLDTDELRIANFYDVRYILSSDAHKPENVGSVEGAYARVLRSGIEESRIVNLR